MDPHDPYRHLRENLERNRTVTGFRSVKVFCDVCQIFEPDESGLCPLCQPEPARDLERLPLDASYAEALAPDLREDGAA